MLAAGSQEGIKAPPTVDERNRDWPAMLAAAISGEGVTTAFQPIVDVARGVIAGYEALARFPPGLEPDTEKWFEAARKHRIGDQLEAAALEAAFAHRSSLPPNCFLAINITPDELAADVVRRTFDRQGDLTGIVIELTEQTRIESYLALEPYLDRCRAAGALIAIDDAGSGYAGLQHLVNLRPAIIKLDRQFISRIDHDESKRALVETLGAYADRTDCWILAEGIERAEELDVIAQLGVPLAQGFLLGRPAPPWCGIDAGAATLLGAQVRTSGVDTLRGLVEAVPTARNVDEARQILARDPFRDLVVILDRYGRPVGVSVADLLAEIGVSSAAMLFNVDTSVGVASQRAIGRPPASRFDPLVCTDDEGCFVGVVRMERAVEWLVRATPTDAEDCEGTTAERSLSESGR